MKWVSRFLRKLQGTSQISRSFKGLKDKIRRVEAERKAAEEVVERRLKALDKLDRLFKEEVANNKVALENAASANRRLQEALQASEEHIKTLEEITIPGLVAANMLFVERYQAETAIQVMRHTLAKEEDKG